MPYHLAIPQDFIFPDGCDVVQSLASQQNKSGIAPAHTPNHTLHRRLQNAAVYRTRQQAITSGRQSTTAMHPAMAVPVGFEPTPQRLTVACSAS